MPEAIFLRFMLMMTMWLPWHPQWAVKATTAPTDFHVGCRGAWMGHDQRIHFCLGEPANYYPMATTHELQHWFYYTQLRGKVWNWDKFGYVAMAALYQGDYTTDQLNEDEARYFYSQGGHELHAQLPWITKGKIPPSLQDYYPWFDLESE